MKLAPTLAALLFATHAAAAGELVLEAGTTVAGALERLRGEGLRVVYSSALVPRSLMLDEAVRGTDPTTLARAILGQHGLELRTLGSNVLGVVESRVGPRWTLTGRIVSAHDAQPVQRARIEIQQQGYVGWTGEDGGFALRMTGRTERTLTVLADGYAATSQRVMYSGTKPRTIDILLVPAPTGLEEVTIVSSRFTYDDLAATGAFSLTQSDIIAQPKIAEDALQAMARLPGIAYSGVSARPNVRGGETGELLVALDGMPIREAFHLPEYNSAFSAIDENLVARLDAFTGTLPARFGNRLSAVVELESTPADVPAISSLALSTFNARLRTGHRREGAGFNEWLASGRIGTTQLWIDDYSPDVGSPSYGDLFLKARLLDSHGSEWRTGLLWSRSKFEYLDADTSENAQLDSNTAYAWAAVRHEFTDSLAIEGMLGFSDIRSDREGSLAGGLTPAGVLSEERSSQIWDASLVASLQASTTHLLQAGVSMSAGQADYRHSSDVEFDPVASTIFGVPGERSRDSRFGIHRSFASAWLSDRWQLTPRWYLESGLRLDQHLGGAEQRHGYLSPRIAARWDTSPATTLRLSWGRAWQAPEAHELRVEDGEDGFTPAQRADQWVVSAEHRLRGGVALRLEGFYRWMPNPRVRYENLLDPLRLIPDLSPDRVTIAPQSSRMKGMEASAQLERGEWSIWGAYTWSNAEDRIDAQWIPRDWDQRHTLALAASWRRGPWSASAFGSYHSGRPATPVLDTSLESPLLGARNSARLGSYVTLDARIAREFNVRRGRLTAFAQVTNLFNRPNRCCTEIDLPDEDSDRLVLEHESVQTYPILPALGIQWAF